MTDLAANRDLVMVAWRTSPFGTAMGRRWIAPGQTVREIVVDLVLAGGELSPPVGLWALDLGEVYINGVPVPRDFWALVRPLTGQDRQTVVVLDVLPRRGGGALSSIVAIGALLAATAVTGGAAAGLLGAGTLAAGSTGAQVAGAVIGVAGSLAATALAPPPTSPRQQIERGFRSGSIAGNLAEPNGTLQRVIGTRLVYPKLVSPPVAEIVNRKLVVEAVYALDGPHSLGDIRIGGSRVAALEDVSIETRDARTQTSLLTTVTRQGYTKDLNSTLTKHEIDQEADPSGSAITLADQDNPSRSTPKWQAFTTRESPDEFWVHVGFPSGLYSNSSDESGPNNLIMAVPFRLRIRPVGSSTWRNMPEIHLGSWTTGAKQFAFRFHWTNTPPSLGQPKRWSGPLAAFLNVPGGQWTADPYFDDGAGNDYWYYSSGATRVRLTDMKKDGVTFYLNPGASYFPRGTYEVQIIRGCCYDVDNFDMSGYDYNGPEASPVRNNVNLFGSYNDGGSWSAPVGQEGTIDDTSIMRHVSIWNEHPCPDTSFAYIAVKSQGVPLEQLSVLAAGYSRDWNGSSWSTWSTNSNPAKDLRDIMLGDLNPRPLPVGLVSSPSLVAFRDHCTANNFRCDAILDGLTVQQARELVAAPGYGRPYQSDLWGVIIDKDRSSETPVQVFSSRTCRMLGTRIDFAIRPHSLTARYRDKDLDYEEDFVVVYDQGYSAANATLNEEISYDALVVRSDVTARAQFDLKQMRLRIRRYSWVAGPDAISVTNGDLVAIQNDVIHSYAGQARVVEVLLNAAGNVAGLVLDDMVRIKPKTPAFEPANSDAFTGDPAFAHGGEPAFTGGAAFGGVETAFDHAERMSALIRRLDGTTSVHEIKVSEEDGQVIHFRAPFAPPGWMLDEGVLVTTGLFGLSHRRVIVTSIEQTGDLEWTLEGIDEAPELFS